MNNHFPYYSLPVVKNLLTKQPIAAHSNLALAKSSVSDWRRYFKVTQARHYFKSVLFLCLNSLQFIWWAVCGTLCPLPPLSSTPTRTVCRPYWRRGDSVNTLSKEANHA